MKADLASVYGLEGERAKALAILEEFDALSRQGRYISQYERAVVYAGLGMFDRAFQALDKALEERAWLGRVQSGNTPSGLSARSRAGPRSLAGGMQGEPCRRAAVPSCVGRSSTWR